MKHIDELNVLLIYGGTSREREVSAMGAQHLYSILCTTCKSIIPVVVLESGHWQRVYPPTTRVKNNDFSLELNPALSDKHRVWPTPQQGLWINMLEPRPLDIDTGFIVLHGEGGEDGVVQTLLNLADIPYCGSGPLASALALHKIHSKRILKSENIPSMDFFEIKGGDKKTTDNSIQNLFDTIDPPYIVKPCNGGSSLGISRVDTEKEFRSALRTAYNYESHVIVEKALDNKREIEVAVLELHPDSPLRSHEMAIKWQGRMFIVGIGEVVVRNGALYDYKTKYQPAKGQVDTLAQVEMSSALRTHITTTALSVMSTLGLSGYARIDFFLSSKESLYFNEANSIPGFTSTSLFTKILVECGLSTQQITSEILSCSFLN